MNKEKKIFLDILKCLVNNSRFGLNDKIEVDAKAADINRLYDYAVRSKLICATFDAIRFVNANDNPIYRIWQKYAFEFGLKQINRNNATNKILEAAKTENTKAVVFKGMVLAQLYRTPELRVSSDTDILTDRENEDKMVSVLERLGYVKLVDKSKDEVYNYYNEEFSHLVELHFCLWEDFKGERMEILNSLKLDTRTEDVMINGIEVTTLTTEAHLVYMMFHLVKHYILEGANLKFLFDMALFINRYYDEIDWKFFEESMESLSYIEFANSIFYIMVNYMGLRDDAMSHVKLSKSKETEAIELSITDTIEVILDDLLKGGVRGDGSSSFQMLGIMTPYLTGETDNDSDNGLKRKLSIIFPSVKRLDAKRFWYAKKIPLLLPVAWVHKWLNFIFYKIRHHNGTYSASEKLRAADKRITLLKDSGLLK
ncbi:nucleotidyltransferase family protein [Falcatimonas sp. MSJ-15]|uniref:nucleotidyltransferase domain-containing protein n=1 Tax=Falcatimonas sp. MSJ-15 TaxID=2841515 RepID=UPI001C10210D|nr:nucleotidyltransferase family protein [Falcatimonas sp. MSJ-15]MBU5469490.1 nucleotidyltransferase family protein [Falcatimonas sp. MSJ-15]